MVEGKEDDEEGRKKERNAYNIHIIPLPNHLSTPSRHLRFKLELLHVLFHDVKSAFLFPSEVLLAFLREGC